MVHGVAKSRTQLSDQATTIDFYQISVSRECFKRDLWSKNLLVLSFQVFAGMNVYSAEFEKVKEEYNVRGYPTICYFELVSSYSAH